jgi:ribonucleoside-triphosphate reductase
MVTANLLSATLAASAMAKRRFSHPDFQVKEGVNYNPGDPNYDLFQLASKPGQGLFPNFSFLDAPFNHQYYREGDHNTEVATWVAHPCHR